ncbi:MAG: hypothetical protein NTX29_05480 [Actinobacteria bacterium]|nr:hypothetical protein [Actinomycetota bacterium]
MSTLDTSPSTPEQPMLRIPASAHPVPTHTKHGNRRIPALVYVGVLLAVIAALVVGSQSLGWFRTTGQMTASSGERVAPLSGASTSDIKGWMSLQDVLDAYPVTKDAMYAHFAIPADTPTTTTLSELNEGAIAAVDVPSLRSWIDDGATP